MSVSDVRSIKREIQDLLKDRNLTPAEKIKCIDVWAKMLMIEHKLTEGDRSDGSFFSRPARPRKKGP